MKTLSVRFVRSYRSKNGNVTFVYAVSGSAENIESFRAIQSDYYREDEKGQALWFTTRFIGAKGTLIVTQNNKLVPDMSAYDQAASLVQQYGGNFGTELAKAVVGGLLGGNSNTPEAPVSAPAPEEDDLSKV